MAGSDDWRVGEERTEARCSGDAAPPPLPPFASFEFVAVGAELTGLGLELGCSGSLGSRSLD